jgi:hypothetical protein
MHRPKGQGNASNSQVPNSSEFGFGFKSSPAQADPSPKESALWEREQSGNEVNR